jgi:hypothetical protein
LAAHSDTVRMNTSISRRCHQTWRMKPHQTDNSAMTHGIRFN